MMVDNDMSRFFDWLAKPMDREDITAWYLANNITTELSELFRDFCLSFLNLIKETYLGDDNSDSATKVGMTEKQKKEHFHWCWKKTVENFNKENIKFNFNQDDSTYFESFFFELFYNQTDINVKMTIDDFFLQLFDIKKNKSKADLEVFTDIYKVLERSLK
jgi:hypothetical protein